MMRIDPAKLQQARLARAMSQEEAAIATDLSARTIQRIEAGHPASLESTKALLTIFGTDIIIEDVSATLTPSSVARVSFLKQLGHVARAVFGLGFDGFRGFFGLAFIWAGIAKLFVPHRSGVFAGPESLQIGVWDDPPVGVQDILGLWAFPVLVVAGLLLLVSIGRIRKRLRFDQPYTSVARM